MFLFFFQQLLLLQTVKIFAREPESLHEERLADRRKTHTLSVFRIGELDPAHIGLAAAVLRAEIIDVLGGYGRTPERDVAPGLAVDHVLPRTAPVIGDILKRAVETHK